ncbi:glycoside hydrolase family 88/105 protein [Saccharococcus caldoxylosilyticus]|uniref:glycoside hydrolase family 88/105 protein n=1 Tax=Saccharococcus caldoxylosilyticus TaxID=81408 RepID=UPI001FCC6FDC|nr:glycoside hydrolase family 88 protein [Parageobacillus caldoxylosilyticus]BDG36148.1 unsaturated rhamnogalacturonyl hydrolase YesR [Parageobacillus caldoxylosilyticus]BDG39933.1 unsaturated rhamnogalacturonyl hydrolase YesR [Parageobacillus caldoxylosilyticus]
MPQLVFDEKKVRDAIDRVVDRTFKMDFAWDWPAGVAFFGVAESYEATGEEKYLQQLKSWMDEQLEDGLPPLSVNASSIGHILLSLYKSTNEEKYLDHAVQIADFLLHDAEKFADGILQHTVNGEKNMFPQQAWVDTMFMAAYFLLRIGHMLEREDYFNFALKQYHGHEQFLQDDNTNLYYHAWDHLKQNHMSGVFWARGNSWAAYSMARALELIKVQHPSYMVIEGSLRDLLSALVRLQSDSGLWHTVLTDPTSYLETSGSAGIAAALLTRGKLYNKYIQKSIDAILAQIKEDGSVMNVSAGTAVMNDANGYKEVPYKRVQGWGQGLVLAFLSLLLKRGRN